MDLVSIIIPVYNAEKTLHECLDSCICQTYPEIEVIVINDGSRDASLAIAEEYEAKDPRVKVLSQENHGQAFARNVGMHTCAGNYVLFLDSDDWLEPHTVERLHRVISENTNTDFVLFGFNIYRQGKLIRTPNPGDFSFSFGDSFSAFRPIHKLMASPCNKLFKREYLTKDFPNGISYAEDSIFNYQNFKPGTNIRCISDCLYNVRLNVSSGVNNRYSANKLEYCILSYAVEEKALSAYFEDADIEEIRTGAFHSFTSVIVNLALHTDYATFKKELNRAYENAYFSEVLKLNVVMRIHKKIFRRLLIHRRERTMYGYCKLLGFLRQLLNNR